MIAIKASLYHLLIIILVIDIQLELSPSMTEEQFFSFLQTEGLPEDDYKILKGKKS